jgi:hypothetical protein
MTTNIRFETLEDRALLEAARQLAGDERWATAMLLRALTEVGAGVCSAARHSGCEFLAHGRAVHRKSKGQIRLRRRVANF